MWEGWILDLLERKMPVIIDKVTTVQLRHGKQIISRDDSSLESGLQKPPSTGCKALG